MVLLATIVLHAIACRLMIRLGRSPWWSVVVFPVGLGVVIGDIGEIGVIRGALFIAGSLLYLLWFAIAATRSVSPSGRILASLQKKGSLTKAALMACMNKEDLIDRRFRRLLDKKFLRRAKGRLFITEHGRQLLWFISLPARLLRWRELPIGGWQWK